VDFPVPRKSERVRSQQPVTVKYNRDGNVEFTGISRDLSDSGVFLYTESLLEEGAHVDLTRTLPFKAAQPVSMQVRGRVVRVERTPASGIAVEFDTVIIVPEDSSVSSVTDIFKASGLSN
jgi:PilZ domain